MSKISENIKFYRNKSGLKQSDLGKLLGKAPSVIANWEAGTNRPDVNAITKMCEIFNIDANTILGWDNDDMFSLSGINPPEKTYKVPRLGIIACGEPILAIENIDEHDDAPVGMACDFTLVCKGDSMINARINDGDIVYIRRQDDVDNGQIAAVLIDEEVTLKRVYKRPNQLVLMPENTAYEPFIYSENQLNGVRILGKAIEFRSKVK